MSFTIEVHALCTKFLEYSPSWKANSRSAGQELNRLLRNLKALVQKNSLLFHIPSHIPFHALTPCFLKIRFNIILPPTSVSEVVSSLQVFQPEPYMHSHLIRIYAACLAHLILSVYMLHASPTSSYPYICCMPRPPHLPWFCNSNNIRWRVQIIKLFIM
jgi:hypothetical protein